MFEAKIILDSMAPSKVRLTTMQVTYPRFVHAEFMTHRMFSRNAASSRAIPTKKMIKMVAENPAMPTFWGKNKRGMSPVAEIESPEDAKTVWLEARDAAVEHAWYLYHLGTHKQIVNRILEPWNWITVIVTATDWSNFFSLRCHADAQQEIAHIANMMKEAMDNSMPVEREHKDWHMPYLFDDEEEELDIETAKRISVARCARVSYLTQEGKRDIEKDLQLFDRLKTGSGHGHWSPFEHVAMAARSYKRPLRSGNFRGWIQYRKMFKGECQ